MKKDKKMTFVDHLDELRSRIICGLVAIVLSTILGYAFSGYGLEILARPVGQLYFFSPQEALVTRLKISLVIGILLSLPFLLYQFFSFVSPGLTERERRYILPSISISCLLFLAGILFGYFVLIPAGVRVLLDFGTGNVTSMINLSKYFSFVLWLLLFCGLLFQMPLFIFILTKMGIVEPKTLREKRRIAILIIFIVGAVVTPSVDLFTLLILAVPLVLLYEVSVWLSCLAVPKQKDE